MLEYFIFVSLLLDMDFNKFQALSAGLYGIGMKSVQLLIVKRLIRNYLHITPLMIKLC